MQFEQTPCNKFILKTNVCGQNVPEGTFNCPVVQEVVKKIIKNENYMMYNIFNKTLPANHGNYLGSLVEIDIKGKTKDGDKENYIFVKHVVPDEGIAKDLVDVKQSYQNEVFVYSELHHTFNELYREYDIPEDKRLRLVKSYDCNNHVIILENLSRQGFKLLPRLAVMPIDFAQDAIKQLAKFHALSFVLEVKRSNFYEEKIKNLKTPIYIKDKDGNLCTPWKNFMTMMLNQAFKHVHQHIKLDKEQITERTFEKIPKYLSDEIGSVKCLRHGDFKPNNILYKVGADEKVETVLIDYQIINYGSPMLDIFYLLYFGADRAFRKEHVEYLKDIYHETLTAALYDFKLDVNKIYPRNLFEKDYEDYLELGLLSTFVILPILLTEDPEFFKNDMTDKTPKTNETYTERVNEVIEEFIELGIL